MKAVIKAGVFAALFGVAACGANETTYGSAAETASPDNSPPAAAGATEEHSGTGVVKSISGSDITIDHEAIASISWPAMQMMFAAQDSELLSGIKPGDRVTFSFTDGGGTATLTSVDKQ